MPADPPSNGPRTSIALMAIGSEMAGATVLGLLIDYGLGTMPWFTIGLTLFGLVGAFLHLTKMAKAIAAKKGPPAPGGGP